MSKREWGISFDGNPYIFVTAGCSTAVTSADASWSADWTVARGILAYPMDNTFGFRLRPQEGGLDADGQRFFLHDRVLTNGPANGQRAITYLGTRSLGVIPSTSLVTEITSSSTDFDVASAALLNPAGGYVWIDNECIKYDAPVGTTVPIAASGRGAYGSLARDHRAYSGLMPEVWTEFPFTDRRRVVLWRVEGTTATPEWRGYIQTSARTASGQMAAGYEIQCQHASGWQFALTLGLVEASPRIRGIDNKTVRLQVSGGTALFKDTWFTGPQIPTVWNTRDEARQGLQAAILLQIPASSGANSARIEVSRQTSALTVGGFFKGTYQPGSRVALAVGGTVTEGAALDNGAGLFVGKASAEVPGVARTFAVGETGTGSITQTVEVDDVSDLPSVWTQRYTVQDNYATFVQPVLRAALSDDAWLIVNPTGKTADPPSVDGCSLRVTRRRASAYDRDSLGFYTAVSGRGDQAGGNLGGGIGGLFIGQPLQLSLCYQLYSQHWVYALRYGIIQDADYDSQTPASDPPDYLASGADYRDWDWSNTADIIRATAGAPNAQTLFLDGKVTLGQLVTDTCLYNGCVVGVYKSRLRLVVIRPPLPTDTVVAEINSGNWVATPEWIPMPEVLANSVKMEADDGSLIVNDQRSQQRYGKGRELQARLHGVDNLSALGLSPTAIAQSLFQRVLGLWGDPCAMVKVTLSRKLAHTVHLGDYVQITSDWFIPDGRGNRGVSSGSTFSQRAYGVGQVIEIEESLKGTLKLGLLFFSLDGFAGYSPACKVSSIATAQVFMSSSYLTTGYTAKNYAGVDPTTGDAGVSRFKAGDKVRLIVRDDTTPATGTFTILSVDPTTDSVTLTTTPVGWAAIVAGGAWVDLTYAVSSTAGLQTAQRGYAWVADETTNTITGTNDPAQRWSP